MQLNKKTLQNYAEYVALRSILSALKLIPYAVSSILLARLFVLIGYGVGIRRKQADKQLAKVYPDWSPKQRRAVLISLYKNMGLSIAEIYLMKEKVLLNKSRVHGMEHVQEAFALQRGSILATAHFGNWEAARILPTKGIPLSVIVKRQRNILFDRFNNARRVQHGVHLIDMKRGLRDIMQDLKGNRMVAILMDQNAGKTGLILDFLGFPATHWAGVAKLSLRYKVPIVPGFARRLPEGGISFEFEPMVYHPDWDDTEDNYVRLLAEINSVIERYIHQYPDQWFWVHKRWKGTKVMD